MALTREQLEEGIDEEDGTIDDPYQGIATHYSRLEVIASVEVPEAGEGEGYLRVIGDDGGMNVEIRVAFSTLASDGWTRQPR